MNKKQLSERDICSKFITPALINAGWTQQQIREEKTFTDGRMYTQGNVYRRGRRRRADYILYYKANLPIALIEAKDNNHAVGAGMQQALGYGDILDIPFVYASNGDAFIEHDRTSSTEIELPLDAFPSPETLWQRYRQAKGLDAEEEEAILQDYFSEIGGKEPRYYQQVAVNRTVEAIAEGQRRILLVMATGTGKTYTAFQIMWRLWKAKKAKRILFLADRNILVDQAKNNDFRPFGDVITKIQHRNIDKAFEVYLALYQGVSGTEEAQNVYKEFSPDFFDLVVVDECHRGSAAADSAWREILEYFDSATQIGMTATPKETNDVSNIDYFGDPVYIYSLKRGIEDGFLAPYRVVRISMDRDLEGWRPTEGQQDKHGYTIEDREYNRSDFDKNLVIDERTQLVAKKVSEFLKGTDRYAKTIVFCQDIEHAERMRMALVNENSDLVKEDRRYVMRITGDSDEGRLELDNFIDPESRYPVIATTSKLLTTGVDVQTCKLIVLDATINSMTEFKQIIGRGTRLREDYGKRSFTIMDFKGVTRLFADPDYDGDPVQIYEPSDDDDVIPPPEEDALPPDFDIDIDDGPTQPRKYHVNGVQVTVARERVQYFGPNGNLITDSLKDYTRNNVLKQFSSLDDFLQTWSASDKKKVLIDELYERGIFLDALREEVGKEKDLDPFDLICHVAFDQPPLTRRERAEKVRKQNYFGQYGEQARKVLEAVLDKYADSGIEEIEDLKILKVHPFSQMGSPIEIINSFGGKKQYLAALRELEQHLYEAA